MKLLCHPPHFEFSALEKLQLSAQQKVQEWTHDLFFEYTRRNETVAVDKNNNQRLDTNDRIEIDSPLNKIVLKGNQLSEKGSSVPLDWGYKHFQAITRNEAIQVSYLVYS